MFETETTIVVGIAKKDDAVGTAVPHIGDTALDHHFAYALPLQIGPNAYRTQTVPTARSVFDGYRRECDMANYVRIVFRNQRQKEVALVAQCLYYCRLASVAERFVAKGRFSESVYGELVAFAFRPYGHRRAHSRWPDRSRFVAR